MIYVISLVIFVIIVIISLFKLSARQILNPNLWVIIFYSFLLIVHFTFDVKYSAGNKYAALPYFLICIFSVMIGIKYGKRENLSPIYSYLKSFSAKRMAFVSFFFSVILIIDILRNNTILSLGARIDDFKISLIGTCASMFAGLGLVPWLVYLHNFLIKGNKLPYYALLSLFAFISYDIVTGGRQTIFASIVATLVMVCWCLKRRKLIQNPPKIKIPKSVYVAVGIFVAYILLVSTARTVLSDTDSRARYLEYVYYAKVGDETKEFLNKLGPFSDIVTEFGFYYSQELNRLDIMLDYYDAPVYFFPMEMSYIVRRVPDLEEIANDLWQQQELVFSKVNFFAHSWSTFIGNYFVNFGIFGSIIICFITGLIMGGFQKSFELKHRLILLVRLCILMGGIFTSIGFSPLSQLPWFSCIVFCSFFNVYTKSATCKRPKMTNRKGNV